MPSSQDAVLRHALLYLRQLVAANDSYLTGGDNMLAALQSFDADWGNIAAAQSRLAKLVDNPIATEGNDEIQRRLLDFCNSYPDAGAYLINLRLSPQERMRWLEAALQASRLLNNDLTTQAHLGNIGLAYWAVGEFQQAISFFEQALQLAEKIGDLRHQGIWAGDLGNAYASLGEHEKAIHFHQQHLESALQLEDPRNQGHAYSNLGVSYAALSRPEEARQSYQRHLEIARQLQDKREECHALVNLGFAYFDLGDLALSRSALEQALSLSEALDDPALLALARGGLADVLIDEKDFEQARALLNKALEALQEFPDVHAEMRILGSLGNACLAADDFEAALEYYEQLSRTAAACGDLFHQSFAISNQVSVYRSQGNYEQACSLASEGLELAQKIQSRADEAFLQWQLGLIHEALGEYAEAIHLMEQAVWYDEEVEHPSLESHQAHLQSVKDKLGQG